MKLFSNPISTALKGHRSRRSSGRRGLLFCLTVLLLAGCAGSEERAEQYLERAQQNYDAGDYVKARVDLRNVLQINDKHVEARYLFALLYERDQNWQQMFANLQMVVELAPGHVLARLKLGALLMGSGAFEAAMKQADDVLALEPENTEGHALKAAIYFRSGDANLAIASAQKALSLEPGNVSAITVLSQAYKADNPERALQIIEAGIEQQSETALLKLLAISVHEQQGNVDKAVVLYRELIEEHPDNLYYYYRFVSSLEKNKRVDEAEQLIRDIVRARPEEIELKLWLAQYLANQRDLPAAEAALMEFIARTPGEESLELALAEVLIAQRKLDDARVRYQGMIARDPESELAQKGRNGLVRLELASGERERGEALLQEIFAVEKENPTALLTQAQLMVVDGKLEAAIAGARSVLRHVPDSVPALELLAQTHAEAGEYALSLDNYRQIMVVQPGHVGALNALTEAALGDNDLKLAIDLASSALRVNPENGEAARLLISAYTNSGRLDDAVREAEALTDSDRSRVMGTYLLGQVHLARGDLVKARQYLEQTILLEPYVIEALQTLLRMSLAAGDKAGAYTTLEQHIAKYPGHGHALTMLGALYQNDGQIDRALEFYARSIQLAPEYADAYIAKGDLHLSQKDIKAAWKTFQAGMLARPRNPVMMVRAGQVAETLGEYTQAVTLYETTLAIGNDVIARNNLAMLYADRMRTDDNLRKALSLMRPYASSDSPALLDTLGWVYYRIGDAREAVRQLEAALEKSPTTAAPEIQYHLGMALLQADRPEEARTQLEASARSGRKFDGLQDALDSLKAI